MNKPFPLPVRAIGPGSQAEDDELQYLAMPRDMATFAMPRVPEAVPPDALVAARDLLADFLAAYERWDPASGASGPRLDLTGVPQATLAIVNDMLGEGEVSIQVGGERPHRIQESVFTGVWRVCAIDGDGRLAADAIEAAPVPDVALAIARAAGTKRIASVEIPPGAMNSPALLAEIGAQLAERRHGAAAHVLNLTLFPLTPDDHQVLERALPAGPVAMISRGFGNCRITSTTARNVWWVQYFNSMNTLILNTIEVVDVPEVALAAVEDLVDSRARLAELIEWMDSSIVEATQ
jgi:hydrogenase-1 operon protein HyaF